MECILVALPSTLGLIAMIQWLSGDEEGALRLRRPSTEASLACALRPATRDPVPL